MENEVYNKLWTEFIEKERKTFLKGKRKYVHFDNKIGFDDQILNNPAQFELKFNARFKSDFYSSDKLLKSGFYPFIKVTKEVPRYKFDEVVGHRVTTLKSRPLCYASHFDALRYSWYSTILNYCYEGILKNESFNKSVLAYRKLKEKASNIEFAFGAFKEIKDRKNCTALAFDISKFFDKINHKVLYSNWVATLKYIYPEITELPSDHLKIYKNLTEFQFVSKPTLDDIFADFSFFNESRNRFCTPKQFREFIRGAKLIESNSSFLKSNDLSGGIPQGAPISAVLANISMIDFDRKLYNLVTKLGGVYFRYSDDLLIIIEAEYKDEIKSKAEIFLREINLQFNDKTEIINFREEGTKIVATNESGNIKKLQYLGFEFDGNKVYLRSSSLSKYHASMKNGVRKAISIAFGKYGDGKRVYKSKLLKKFTQSGKDNFIYYATRANEINSEDKTIQKQYSKQYKHLNKSIKRKTEIKLKKKKTK
ncbi:MAG: hypothetical protein JNJ40_03890 [Bacteroidia bacterium]|nr:hypothetical protein [Bacteroidia bacterium]